MTNNRDFTPNLPLWSFQVKSDSQLALKNRKDLEIYLISRSLKDEDFKQQLIANPKAVIEQELGTKLPEELKINVLEETEDTIYMVLPCNPYEGMSEEELQASLGMTYEDVAQWVLEQQSNTLLDEQLGIKLVSRSWKQKEFKYVFLNSPKDVMEKEWQITVQANIDCLEETFNSLYIVIPRVSDDFWVDQSHLINSEWWKTNVDESVRLLQIAAGTQLCLTIGGGTC